MSAEEQLSYLPNNPSFSSNAIHCGNESKRWSNRDIVPPICIATIYEQDLPPDHKGFQYTRLENPTRNCLQDCLAKLEDTNHCLVFPSGTAAASLVIKLLKKGDHVVAQQDTFHGTLNMFKKMDAESDDVDFTFVDGQNTDNFTKAVQKRTSLVWLETPTNPLMKLTDLRAVVSVIRSISPSAVIACDNTFMTPYFQRPANFGVDIVIHSCSKYIGGHSDILMGALCMNSEELYKKLKNEQIMYGPIPSSFDCSLVLRSLKTLELRMQRHMANGLAVATFLEQHPMVEKVFYPGLKSHPQHQLSLKQCYGNSGIFSFYLKDHNFKTTRKIVGRLRFIKLAESLGGTDTVMKIPRRMNPRRIWSQQVGVTNHTSRASMKQMIAEHLISQHGGIPSVMPPNSLTLEELEEQGITDWLMRISVGLENAADIIADLEQALDI